MPGKRRQTRWNLCRSSHTLCCTALAAAATVVCAILNWERADATAHAALEFRTGTASDSDGGRLHVPVRPLVSRYKIFTFWDYPTKPSPWVSLNIETWRASAPADTEIVFVNNSNFKQLVPDAPEEFFRLPYAACKSDVVRAAVLYHHGGLYMDTDFLALGNLGSVFSKLDAGWDIVAYSDEESSGADAESGPCKQDVRFSSNFMAARKGNPFSRTWWTNIKAKLTRQCGEGEFQLEKVCCHEVFSREPERRPCHIPWAHLEWLKNPRDDPDAKGPPQPSPGQSRPVKGARSGPDAEAAEAAVRRGNEKAVPLPQDVRLYCLKGSDSVAPHLNGEVYWQPWDAKAGSTLQDRKDSYKYDVRFACRESPEGDLACDAGNWGRNQRKHRRFFRRLAYHLFFSTRKMGVSTRSEAVQGDWLLSELYRRALAPRPPPSAQLAAPSGQLAPPSGQAAGAGLRIFTYWNFPDGAPSLVRLNLETWYKHAPRGAEVVLVNDSNIRQLVPDAPDEWFRLPYAECKADVAKAAVLYHQGGLYLETDYLVSRPLNDIFGKLEEGWDLVVHLDGHSGSAGACPPGVGFSSSFMAARKHNHFSLTWWENIKRKLKRSCEDGGFTKEKVCCREVSSPPDEKRQCHVPWLHLEMLKNPLNDEDLKKGEKGEGVATPLQEGSWRAYCLTGSDGLVPHESGEVYWQPWGGRATQAKEGSEETHDMRFDCRREDPDDLFCTRGSWGAEAKTFSRFFARRAHHLSFSGRQDKVKSREDALEYGWLLSSLYRSSLGLPQMAQQSRQGDAVTLAPLPAVLESEGSPQRAPGPHTKYNIYTFWDYSGRPSPFVQLNVESWIAHAPEGTEIIKVNNSNIRTLVPDIPEEWFRLPYAACKSDVVRASVLYHQGGLYMDTDFLVQEPLHPIFDKLDEGWDVVAYSDEATGGKSGQCENNRHFSSNFMAARKGNGFSATWWTNVRHKMTRTCAEGEFELEKVCCHEAFGDEPERRVCHIPWAYLEWLKVPEDDPDGKGPPGDSPDRKRRKIGKRDGPEADAARKAVAEGNTPAVRVPKDVRLYCLRGPDGMAPHLNGEVFWQPWDSVARTSKKEGRYNAGKYDMRFKCREEPGGDLACDNGNWGKDKRTIKRFFHRTAVHIFFSTRKPDVATNEEALKADWLLSELYRRSFSRPDAARSSWHAVASSLLEQVPATTEAPPVTAPPPNSAAIPPAAGTTLKYNIITYWDYPNGPPPFVQLNVQTWLKHAPPGAQLLRVNDSNFQKLVPDAPEEVFRLPYPACKSDVVRAAVLYHQGGLYMDTDFLVLRPLLPVFQRLESGWDIVTYNDDARGESGTCNFKKKFSSNFMAARPGNPFSRTWWQNIKHKLMRTCAEGEFQYEKVCCHEAFAREPETRRCHIPWAHLEWLKIPMHDSDARRPYKITAGEKKKEFPAHSGPEAELAKARVDQGNAPALNVPAEAKLFCLAGPDNVAPHFNGEVYWQPWDVGRGVTIKGVTDSKNYDLRFDCTKEDRNLRCDAHNWGTSRQIHQEFFNRVAYHLFFSTRSVDVKSPQQVLEGNWLISELYRKSLGMPDTQPR